MLKIKVVMDDDKIRRERLYDLEKVHRAVDSVFVGDYGFIKGDGGFFIESGKKDDFVDFFDAILFLKDESWFMDNVKTWLWYNSDDSSNPEDFAIDDIKEHYLRKLRKSA
jgi:hypothetical protein